MRRALLLALLLAAPRASASKPVERTLSGCVLEGAFFSVSGKAYRISTPASLDLRPFEGKGISLRGWLSPGDRFAPADGARPELLHKSCPPRWLRLIRHEHVLSLRVAATKAANAGEHDRALTLIGQAIALLSPPDCDTFTDRAHVLALKGDLRGAAKDLALIKARKRCVVERRMNPLLLQDLAKALAAKGDKRSAILALQLALSACDGDWCRPDILKELRALKK